MAIIQFRVDDDIKKQAISVYEKLGIDLSTALRMFLRRSIAANGVPFSMILDEEPYDEKKALDSMDKMQKISESNGNSEMSLEEINREIGNARKEKR